MAGVSLYAGQVLRRAKKQWLVAQIEVDAPGKYRIEVSNLEQITLNLHFF